MEESTRRSLLAARSLTLEALQTTDPALAGKVASILQESARRRIDTALGALPAATRQKARTLVLKQEGDIASQLQTRLAKLGVDASLSAGVVRNVHLALRSKDLRPDQPLETHPVLATLLATAHVHEVSALAGLSGKVAEEIVAAAPGLGGLDEATLGQLVDARKITETQAQSLGFAAALYPLVGQDASLAAAIQRTSFPSLGDKPPLSTRDLALLDAASLQPLLTSADRSIGAVLPPSADVLAARFAALHPGVVLRNRLLRKPGAARPTSSHRDALARHFAKRKAALEDIGDRLLVLDLGVGSPEIERLSLGGGAEESEATLAALRAYQRVTALTLDIGVACDLVEAGFSSAHEIVSLPIATLRAGQGSTKQAHEGSAIGPARCTAHRRSPRARCSTW